VIQLIAVRRHVHGARGRANFFAAVEPDEKRDVADMPFVRLSGWRWVMVSEEAVRQRSYEIWLREGRPEGKALEHWLRAKGELAAGLPQRPKFRTFEYYMYRFEEWQRAVQPKPQISVPPQVRMATRVSREDRPAAAA
jgi:hypothetical protein